MNEWLRTSNQQASPKKPKKVTWERAPEEERIESPISKEKKLGVLCEDNEDHEVEEKDKRIRAEHCQSHLGREGTEERQERMEKQAAQWMMMQEEREEEREGEGNMKLNRIRAEH